MPVSYPPGGLPHGRKSWYTGRQRNTCRMGGEKEANEMTMDDLEHRVVRYWTARSHDFGAVRKNELGSAMGRRWLEELENYLPKDRTLDILDVDKLGLDNNDRTLLLTMIRKFSGGPVGLETLAASIGEDSGTLEDVYEPYLLMNGLIMRTPRGRMATDLAYRHLGIDMEK